MNNPFEIKIQLLYSPVTNWKVHVTRWQISVCGSVRIGHRDFSLVAHVTSEAALSCTNVLNVQRFSVHLPRAQRCSQLHETVSRTPRTANGSNLNI